METLREFYKIGNGPSSSHTMGPERAASLFRKRSEEKYGIDLRYRVELYGSLAATGKGHLTDYIIRETLQSFGKDNVEVVFMSEVVYDFHTNAVKFSVYEKNDKEFENLLEESLFFSVGGGTIVEETEGETLSKNENVEHIYPQKNFKEIMDYCEKEKITLPEYVETYEGKEIWNYLKKIWEAMDEAVYRGLNAEGYLHGQLKLERKAKKFYEKYLNSPFKDFKGKVYSYALAVSEENASAGKVVTAPTCGASGLIPALLKTFQQENDLSEEKILKSLAVAGVIGNIYKQNASISGAEVGCQGEVGVACSMGAGMVAYIMGADIAEIEYAAEIAMEHCLGMTCDPMLGYVQIPCIERNAIYAAKAVDCAQYSLMSGSSHLISLDEVVETMLETGKDLHSNYKETSLAGLAKLKKEKLNLE
ncbi:L-serine ammonia-lyase [Leptotrichia sp. OH3620_COT-345]|uniref:L-serine ammonia-lyase n=1 Tax=Leptotrichia sp. OH3620_COT-345 TaxID=2491048 RepID=UPI000F646E86|nr:L-serine ammonia-lyase [Leptotrichia sp. OH3620_COT-345]RRD40994.1 L-serine ammonia-lyase [Leptotrichia sp. OH3620_COT-345]